MSQAGVPRPLFQPDDLARRLAALAEPSADRIADQLAIVLGHLHGFAEVDGDPEREDAVLTEEFARELDLTSSALLRGCSPTTLGHATFSVR